MLAVRYLYARFVARIDDMVTPFEKSLPVYIRLKDQAEPAVLMATSVEVLHHGDRELELILRDGPEVVGRFERSAYAWWMEDRYALLD